MKVYDISELISSLRTAAASSPAGEATLVRLGDWEGNLSANGFVETLEVKYDPVSERVVIYCDPNEH